MDSKIKAANDGCDYDYKYKLSNMPNSHRLVSKNVIFDVSDT